jgi:hypothetical protein
MSMAANTSLSRAEHAEIRAQLRTLRTRLTQARDLLVHFKEDRIDRDKLEPAARRVDDLMDMFVGDRRDTARGPLLLAEVQSRIEESTNPKAAEALSEARIIIAALRKAFGPAPEATASSVPRIVPGNDQ